MKLSTLVRLLGLVQVAKRAGVTPATIRRWLRHGPSDRGKVALKQVAKRRRRAQKAAKTRTRQVEYRSQLPIPVTPVLDLHDPNEGDFEDPTDLLPKRRPIETAAQLRDEMQREGHDLSDTVNTEMYAGEREWFTVGQPLVNVPLQSIIESISDVWHSSGRRWVVARFLFFRYIPFNPLYRGEMLKDQGKWKPWWTSTLSMATELSIKNNVGYSMGVAYEAAQSRLIWFEGYRVDTFDLKQGAKQPSGLHTELRTS